jgi:mannosyltransferase
MSVASDPEVIVFNLKRRYTGVSATVNALVPIQLPQWRLGYCGNTLSNGVVGMSVRQALSVSRRPAQGRRIRIWHLRRDHEMLLGIWARDVLRLPIRLVFTSAAQHRHSVFPRWLISRMDAVISTTPRAADYVPNTTAIVPHGVDLRRFAAHPNKAQAWDDSGLPGQYGVGIFGRVRPDKGTDVFVEAMIQALPSLPGVTAIIAGLAQAPHRSFEARLRRRIRAAGLSDRIVFLGEVPADEVGDWYRRCLVCVACPRYEPFGLTPFEAAASGCALICSRTGAFESLIDSDAAGRLIDTGNVQQLAQAIREVMADPALALQMGHTALARVQETFSVQREAQGIGEVYRRLFAA